MVYRPTEKTRAARAQRRAALLKEATELVATGGFAAATVKAIAERSGLSVGTVYSYFDGNTDLLAAVFRAGADQELAVIEAAVSRADDAPARVRALVETFAMRAIRGRQLAWSLLFEPVDPRIEAERLTYRAAYHRLTTEILREGIEAGVFGDQHLGVTAAALIGAVSESLTGRLSPSHAVTADEEADDRRIVESILRFCFHGIDYTGDAARRAPDAPQPTPHTDGTPS
ncbi:TetR/AcrR family transcriptional regulator [Nocardia jinanensis]|uniref:TetR family transcriptional regulator n=1 Tax=Nocardia jinanensis TaxID=382504 RepID=A0A917RDS2_9NOCA|nr:TetR/AcrR family transcriptional regulator [Nocardia jinanensis]GGL02406.1 TetR family transcriptional regulator [Nocardia jinanensis]